MGEFTLYERSLAPQACIYPLKLNKEGLTVESLTPTIDRIVELCLEAVTAVDVKAPIPSIEGIQLDVSDFECSLCTGIVYEPVTITCGHSFCSPCLKRAFDHSQTCPVCRTILYEVHVRLHQFVLFVLISVCASVHYTISSPVFPGLHTQFWVCQC